MKIRNWLFGALILMLLVIVAACSNSDNNSASNDEVSNDSASSESTSEEEETESADVEQFNFRLNAGLNSEDNNTAAFTTPWMEEVTNKTDGNVTFDAFFSEELVPMGEELRALEDGVIDIAAPVLPTYNPDLYPLSDVVMLPLKHSDSLIAARAFADLVKSDQEIADGKTFSELEYGQHGMKALPVQPVAEYTIGLVGNKKVKSASDLQNLSLRTGGRAHEIFVKQIGSGSVSMPWSEEFEALNRGAIDGNVRSVQDYAAYGFDEMITTALSGISIGHFPFIWLMTEEKWNELPENLQTIMEETAYELADSTMKIDLQNEAIEKAKETGIEFIEVSSLDQDAQDLLEEATLNTWTEWIESKENDGYPGKAVAKLWAELIVKNGGEIHEAIASLE